MIKVVVNRFGYTEQLLGRMPTKLRDVIEPMLAGVPEASRQLSRGNAVTAFRLLREAGNITVKPCTGYTKEMLLSMAFNALPPEFRLSDIDAD